jgi:hypothetical protein
VPERDDDLHADDVRKILADLDEKAAKRPPPTEEELEAARAEYDAAMTAVHEAAERARRVKPFSLPAEAKITPKVIIERAETGHAKMGRRPTPLKLASVLKAEERLKARRKVVRPGERAPEKSLAYAAIAVHAGLRTATGKPNRDRVAEIEMLMELGWDLRKSHPDFSAEDGWVRLPTAREAARLLRSR